MGQSQDVIVAGLPVRLVVQALTRSSEREVGASKQRSPRPPRRLSLAQKGSRSGPRQTRASVARCWSRTRHEGCCALERKAHGPAAVTGVFASRTAPTKTAKAPTAKALIGKHSWKGDCVASGACLQHKGPTSPVRRELSRHEGIIHRHLASGVSTQAWWTVGGTLSPLGGGLDFGVRVSGADTGRLGGLLRQCRNVGPACESSEDWKPCGGPEPAARLQCYVQQVTASGASVPAQHIEMCSHV